MAVTEELSRPPGTGTSRVPGNAEPDPPLTQRRSLIWRNGVASGREMQARVPKARHRSEHPRSQDAHEAAELGCALAHFGPVGLLLGFVASVVWFLTRRRRRTGA